MAGGDNQAIIRITADDRLLDGILGRVIRKMHAFGVSVQNVVKSSMKGIGDITGFEGLGGLAASIRSAKSYAAALLLVQQQSELSASQVNQLRAKIDQLAVASGASQQEILAGVTEFHQVTGDYAKAVEMMDLMAKVSKATKTEMKDVADASAALMRNFKIENVSDMARAFDIITTQASKGKVEVRDYAANLADLAGAADKFSAKGVQGAAELGALIQTAAQVYGKPDEAVTAMKLTLNAIYNRAAKLKEAGVDIFSKEMGGNEATGVAGDPLKITRAIVSKIKPGELGQILGLRQNVGQVIQALRSYSQLTDKFLEMDDAVGAVDRRMQNYTDSAIFGFDKFNAVATKAVNDLFLGRLKDLADILMVVAKWLTIIADHPLSVGIPALIAFKGLPSMLSTAGMSLAARGGLGPGGMAGFGQVQNVFIAGAAPGVFGAGGVPGVGGGGGGVGGGKLVGPSGIQMLNGVITAASLGITVGTLIANVMGFYDNDDSSRGEVDRYGRFAPNQIDDQNPNGKPGESNQGAAWKPGSGKDFFPDLYKPGMQDLSGLSANQVAEIMRSQIDVTQRLQVAMDKNTHAIEKFIESGGMLGVIKAARVITGVDKPPSGKAHGTPRTKSTDVGELE